MSDEKNGTASGRHYDKGEGRFKHVGRSTSPEIVPNKGHPQKPIGKCPNNISKETRQSLLDRAIPWPDLDDDEEPANLYTVYKGTVYEAMSSDAGVTWHGYPFHGRLSSALIEKLRQRAKADGCEDDFRLWERKHLKKGAR